MSFDTLVKVANCLHIPTDYLIKGEQQAEKQGEIEKLLAVCSEQELALITDVLKAAIPHLRLLNQDKG